MLNLGQEWGAIGDRLGCLVLAIMGLSLRAASSSAMQQGWNLK